MLVDASDIEDAPSSTDLRRRQAELDPDECHPFAVQAYWGLFPRLASRRDAGEHLRLRAAARELARR